MNIFVHINSIIYGKLQLITKYFGSGHENLTDFSEQYTNVETVNWQTVMSVT